VQLANNIKDHLGVSVTLIEAITVTPPGFINFKIALT
jgi:arginyl-tRNA synthetase